MKYSDLQDKEFKRIKEYVDKLDIDEILSSLEVSISEYKTLLTFIRYLIKIFKFIFEKSIHKHGRRVQKH